MKAKKLVGAAAIALSMAAGLAVSASPASAASNSSVQRVDNQDASAQARWVYYDWYWSGETCGEIGENGRLAGRWQAWDCRLVYWPPTPPWFDLYIYL